MKQRIYPFFVKLLTIALVSTQLSLATFAQQQADTSAKQTPAPAGSFGGSLFGGRAGEAKPPSDETKTTDDTKTATETKTSDTKPLTSSRVAASFVTVAANTTAAPAPSPIPYLAVAVRMSASASSRESGGDAFQQTTAPQTPSSPAPSANTPASSPNPPAPSANSPVQGAPVQSPQTASPTQSQTQQSANPAAPASQTNTTAQPTVPPTAQPVQPTSEPQAPVVQGTQGQTPTTISAPGTQIQSPQGVTVPGRESVQTAAPADVTLNVPQVANDYRATPAPMPVLERVGVDMSQQRTLGVREAIEMALTNNKDIEVARENVRSAEFDLQGARGVYDPRFATNSYYERTETPTASVLSGSTSGAVTQSGFFSSSSFQGLTPKAGGGYRVDFVSNRITTDNQFASLNPQYPTSLTFNYTQPILRGRQFDANRRLIEIAKKNLNLTDVQFRQRAIETITNVQRAYWDLVFALRNLQVQRDAVRDARSQLEHNERLVKEGFLAPIDVVAASAQISGFEQSVYSALDDVGRAENTLKNYIAENRDATIWNVAIVPTDSVDLKSPVIDLQSALTTALKSRPEIQSSDVALAINEIENRFAREQSRAQVDLVGSYGLVGLAGPLNLTAGANPLTASNAALRDRVNQLSTIAGLPVLPPQQTAAIPDILVGGYAQSLTNLAANRFTNFRVGVNVNIPLRNRTAEAQLGRTLVDRQRIGTQREQLEQLIQVDVRNSLQLVRTAESRLRSAAAARSASEQQYASEQRRLDAGQSTVFLVLERQTALATSRGNELRAQTELNKAIADLQRATGNALEENRVEIRVH